MACGDKWQRGICQWWQFNLFLGLRACCVCCGKISLYLECVCSAYEKLLAMCMSIQNVVSLAMRLSQVSSQFGWELFSTIRDKKNGHNVYGVRKRQSWWDTYTAPAAGAEKKKGKERDDEKGMDEKGREKWHRCKTFTASQHIIIWECLNQQ